MTTVDRTFPFILAFVCGLLAALQIPMFPSGIHVITFVICFTCSIGNLIFGVLIYNEHN